MDEEWHPEGDSISSVAESVSNKEPNSLDYYTAMMQLWKQACTDGIGFRKSLEKAWDEIKDRKGMMIDGKYVKWDSMTEEQKAEFNRRDSGNTLIRE